MNSSNQNLKKKTEIFRTQFVRQNFDKDKDKNSTMQNTNSLQEHQWRSFREYLAELYYIISIYIYL